MALPTSVSASRITAPIGVELTGVDLRDPGPAVVEVLQDAVDRHHVVVIRDQLLDAGQHQELAERFGSIVRSPVQQVTAAARAVSTIEDTAELPPAGFDWHTDLSWIRETPALGFLNAITIPSFGGDTLWCSTAAIYDNLSDADRGRCDRLAMSHAPDATLLASIERRHGLPAVERVRSENPAVEHALVRTHPRSGRRSLFLSPLYARRATRGTGVDEELIERLHAMLDDASFQMRWRWRPGDFVLWDETTTCHRALTDHHPQRRVMRRCVTAPTGRPTHVRPD